MQTLYFRTPLTIDLSYEPPKQSLISGLIAEYRHKADPDLLHKIAEITIKLKDTVGFTFVQEHIQRLVLELPFEKWGALLPRFDATFGCLGRIIWFNLCRDYVLQFVDNLRRLLEEKTTTDAMKKKVTDVLQINDQILTVVGKDKSYLEVLQIAYAFFAIQQLTGPSRVEYAIEPITLLQKSLTISQIDQLTLHPYTSSVALLLRRYVQLFEIDRQDCKLSDVQKLIIADFIEIKISNVEGVIGEYMKKQPHKLPFTLLNDPLGGFIYILLKGHETSPFYKTGTFKKVTSAIRVPRNLHEPGIFVAQTVNKNYEIRGDFLKSGESRERNILLNTRFCQLMDKEVAIYKSFEGKKGIWPFFCVFKYKKQLSETDVIIKTMLFSPQATRDLSVISRKEVYLSLHQHVSLCDQLAHGLYAFHVENKIHGDLKDENALFSLFIDQIVLAGLIDFGLACTAENATFSQGYYGSVYPTAPELFGNKKFTGDVFKVEIWAFGYIFYPFVFGKIPSWEEIVIEKKDNLKDQVAPASIEAMRSLVERDIEHPREILVAKDERSLLEEYQLLVYDMMRLDPSLRLDTAALIERTAALQEKSLSLVL